MNLGIDHQWPLTSQKERQPDVTYMVVPSIKYSYQTIKPEFDQVSI